MTTWLWTYSQYAIEAVKPHEESHVIISIRTPGAPRAGIRRSPATRDVLYIEFPDLSYEYKSLPPVAKTYSDDELFNERHAEEILAFVAKHKGVQSIIVQCEGGLSRSVAVKAALGKILNGDETPYDGTNRLVYDTMLKAASSPTRA